MQNTYPIIPRPASIPPVRVLEIDGPRRKHVQRGEGFYYLATDNHPPITDFMQPGSEDHDCQRFAAWWEPNWEIYQMNDGSVEIHACRPSKREVIDGDLHGEWGSVIRLARPSREAIRHGLRLARRLTRCRTDGVLVNHRHLSGIAAIETNIPVFAKGLV